MEDTPLTFVSFLLPGLTSHFNSKLCVQLLQKSLFTLNYLVCIVVSPHSPGIMGNRKLT